MLFGLNEAAGVNVPSKATNLFNNNFDFHSMGQEMIAESCKAWNKIELMTTEANCRIIHENATNPQGLTTLIESAIKGFFNKIKEFFIKLKNMVVEVFQKFMMWLNSKTKSEKEFAMKYEKEIMGKITSLGSIDVKGFTYTHLTDTIADVAALESFKLTGDTTEEKKENGEKLVKLYRGALVGTESKEVETEDFADALFAYYRSGEDEADDITINSTSVKNILSELKTFATSKSAIEKDKAKIEKALNQVIKTLEQEEKAESGSDEESQAKIAEIQLKIAAMRDMYTARNQAFTAKIAAVKESAEFGKRVLLSIKSAKKTSESVDGLHGLFSLSV